MLKKHLALLLFWCFAVSWPSLATDVTRVREAMDAGAILSGHVIFKISEAAAARSEDPHLIPPGLKKIIATTKAGEPHRVFPDHRPPSERYHHSGRPMADLSRIFEIVVDDEEQMWQIMAALHASGLTEYVQPRYVPGLLKYGGDQQGHHPNDSLLNEQYYLKNIAAFEGWNITRGDTSVVVGIVDTGVELDHPDLVDAIAYNWDDPINGEDSDGDGYVDNFYGWDLGEGDNDPTVNNSAHGIHVSGIAAATPDNYEGIAGVGYYSRFLPVKVDDELGRLTKAYEGIVYAADQGVDVINCSWGSHFNAGPFGQDIIDYAVLNHDVLVVAAAGNADDDVPFYPASFDLVLSVAATDSLDNKAGFSSYGPFVDIAAPGHQVKSTWVNASYMRGNGTSMASPVVAGAAALLRSRFPELSALQIKAMLKVTADPIDQLEENLPYASQLGNGRLNIFRALTETHHSYIRIAEHLTSAEALGNVGPEMTFSLEMFLQNMLAPLQTLRAVLTTDSDKLNVLTDTLFFDSIDSLQVFDNRDDPLLVETSAALPDSHHVLFTLHFYDEHGQQIGRRSFRRVLNRDYLNVEAGPIKTTFSGYGALGFNYPDYSQGWGLTYEDGYTVLRNGGFLFANSASRVVDNVYGSEAGTFSDKLIIADPPVLHTDHMLAPLVVSGRLQDHDANGGPPLGLDILWHAYLWDYQEPKDYFILHYQVINQSEQTYEDFYAGFFADWVLRNNKMHRATIDVSSRMAYAYSDEGGHYTGIQLLSAGGMRHYAFDNQGAKGSMRIDDGFSDVEKYAALTNNRLYAGFYDADNDISSLISHGPNRMQPGDTLSVGFAMHFGDQLQDMRNQAMEAALFYQALDDIETQMPDVSHKPCAEPFLVYPNPFQSALTLRFCPELKGRYMATIYGQDGSIQAAEQVRLTPGQKGVMALDVGLLSPGMYLLRLHGKGVDYSRIVMKER